MTAREVEAFAHCMCEGGVAVFPADTVYGLACDPNADHAVHRLYALKGRSAAKPAAVMFFSLPEALAALPELGAETLRALRHLLPGAVTVLLPDPVARFALAGGPDPGTLGLRVPRLAGDLAPLTAVRRPVLQSSANESGGPDPRRVQDISPEIRLGVDLVLDGGELPGTASTVVDLRGYENERRWSIVRDGKVSGAVIAAALARR